ncbi:MAG: hypothetical protein GXO33_01870 [Epsilonproteobacteria bacterium]|nr:hypothetical protein [Campylobacterota bacterium]
MKKYVMLACVAVLFGGCATGVAKKMVPKLEKPKEEVVANETRYSVSLQMIGDMLYEIKDPDIYVYIAPITNKTTGVGKVPEDIAGMLKSAFLNMGYKVHVVSNPELIPKGAEGYVIEGEISEFDVVRAESAGMNLGLYFGQGKGETDASAESDYGYQEINLGLDLRVLDATTGEYVPFVFAKNKVTMKRLEDSNKIGFSVAGNGFGLSGKAKVQNGVHESLRLLSEISSVELLGKLRLLPYWLAIPNAMPEYQVINNYKRKFRSLPKEKQISFIYYLLQSYYPDMREDQFAAYIRRFKKEHGLYPADEKITPKLFVRMLMDLPKKEVRNDLEQRRSRLLDSVVE